MEMIVANAGVEANNTAGRFAVFSGLTAGFDLDGAESVGADAGEQQAVGGLRDVEAVKQRESLISLRSSDMRLARCILHYAGNEIKHVAIVVGRWIRDIDDVDAGNFFLRRNLGRVDRRGGLLDVYN